MLTTEARRVLSLRMDALAAHDLALVRECEDYLARLGVDRSQYEPDLTTVDDAAPESRPIRSRSRRSSS